MRNLVRNALNIIAIVGSLGALNSVPFAFLDLISINEAITVIILGGSITAIAGLLSKLIK